ncbi:cytochrome ubiquinol oxidase subunit I [Streptomyces sp. GS7]|uniref:cytochrome ubiquinol oxidase subunit I n=1 Tax=Streptomyces sp. GS7 TaxID=2692234 RepID=UPI0013182842|nr:cytochrome ubiquinol oxidase subunit I [Streptomyces sp. GS7]QHC21428.1 cytochrome ubiquinol oxidase subunit I [Streptomyces sp. GS7]
MHEVDLARLQFATTATLHFLFVALTLGLVTVVAAMQTRAMRTSDRELRSTRMRRVRFWGGLYVINYALGIISGLTQEFQFGLNWSGLSHVMGNVVGAPIAVEAIVSFFLESTFLGLWAFGFDKVPARAHLVLIWLVAITAYASTCWIMVVNGFMQKPVGYEMRGGEARVTDWFAILSNGATWYAVFHVAAAVALLAGMFLAAVSAHHILRDHDVEFFRPTLVQGSLAAGIGALVTAIAGGIHLGALRGYQPEKYAVISGETGSELDQVRSASIAKYGSGDWLPPAWLGWASMTMVVIGVFLVLLSWIPATAVLGNKVPLSQKRIRLRIAQFLLPFAFLALISGWITREVGRQPWMVTGELTVQQAVSDVSFGGMLTSFIAFTAVLVTLAVIDWVLIARYARIGPEGGPLRDARPFPPLDTSGQQRELDIRTEDGGLPWISSGTP